MQPSPVHHPRRTRVLAPLLAALLVVGAAACARSEDGGSGGSTTTSADGSAPTLPPCPVDALAEADEKVEIDVWHALGGESQIALNTLADEFNASQDQVAVTIQSQGTSYEEVFNKYVAGIPSKQLPAIAYLEDTTLRQLADSGTVLPAEACEKADGFVTGQLPAVRNYYTSEGIYWPGYTNVSTPVLYSNAVQLEAAGLDPDDPPETLEEVQQAAQALKDSGVPQPMALILNAWFVECWITGAGEELVNQGNGRDGLADESTFDNPATRELYTWIKEMADEDLLEPYSATANQVNHYAALAQKNSALGPETSTAATTIKAVLGGQTYEEGPSVDVGEIDTEGLSVRSSPFPGLEQGGQVRVSGGAFFMTNTGTPEEQAASWEFMKYMWSTDSQVAWHLQGSYLPTTQAAANDPRVQEYWETDLAGQLLEVAYDQLTAVDPNRPGPQIGPYIDYSNAIKDSLERLVLEGDSVDEVVKDADADIQAALDRYIEDNGG